MAERKSSFIGANNDLITRPAISTPKQTEDTRKVELGIAEIQTEPVKEAPKPDKQAKKRGRPSKPSITMSITIEEGLTDVVEAAASLFYKGNRSAYINSLIEKDRQENMDTYNGFIALKGRK